MKVYRNILKIGLPLLLLVALPAMTVDGRPVPKNVGPNPDSPGGGPSLFPPAVTVDQVIQNKGNIVTTIDNWGYIGGYSYYGLPSGEWPRNSGHNYLAEIRYWMGAVNSTGDTIVANSYDDFQAIPLGLAGMDDYKILLSTDSTRYVYDATDTVGLGISNPSYGWRIWDFDSTAWVYEQSYDALATAFRPGGPRSLQDSHYRFNDGATGVSVLGLELTQTCLQWNYEYNEDFIFVILEIHNNSAENYTDFAFGLYIDIDVGGPDGFGENGRLEDVVDFDTTENLAWIYDNVGTDPGWGTSTGIMGTKYIETPGGVGMTAFRTDDWAFLPSDDAGMYAMINSTQFDPSLPPTDQFYVQCSRGIYLPAGGTVRVVFAIIAGENEADFRANAAMAQQSYNNNFVGPEPPPIPVLRAKASNEKVQLYWSDTSEVGTDPLTGENDFGGYRLYRSDNQGLTWAADPDKDTAAVANWSVSTPGDPIPHSYIDRELDNGVEYWYCLAAYDTGAGTVSPLQSGFGIAGEVSNVVSVTPRTDAAGYYDADGTVEHLYNGTGQPSSGAVAPVVFNVDDLLGAEYQVTFDEDLSETWWNLINVTTGDTVLAHQTLVNANEGLYDIVEGMRVVVSDGDHDPRSFGQTGFGGVDSTLVVSAFDGPLLVYWMGDPSYTYGGALYRATYELRYSTDSTMATSMWEYYDGTPYPKTPVPFEVWNIITNQRVSLAMDEWPIDGVWQPGNGLIIVDYPYDTANDLTSLAFPNQYGWRFSMDSSSYAPVAGDILTIQGAPLNGPDDIFSFKVDGINTAVAKNALKDIKVVPNPYFARYDAMVETNQGESVLEFQHLPEQCTIRIYTLAGDLVRTIKHNGAGTARWNLLTSNQQQVASGIYLFHVESNVGEHLGRFAVVK